MRSGRAHRLQRPHSGRGLANVGAIGRCPPNLPPDDFVDLATLPNLSFVIAYATPHNVTGAPVAGYATPGAWMWDEAAVRACA